MFRPLRWAVKDAVFENCHLLKKVDENFIIFKRERTEDARPARERKAANLHLANNANWVQAQPAAKMYSAAILMTRQRAGMRIPYWR